MQHEAVTCPGRSLQRRGRGGGKNWEKSSEVPPSPMSPSPRGRLGATGYKGSGAPAGTSAAPEPEAMWRGWQACPLCRGPGVAQRGREGGTDSQGDFWSSSRVRFDLKTQFCLFRVTVVKLLA